MLDYPVEDLIGRATAATVRVVALPHLQGILVVVGILWAFAVRMERKTPKLQSVQGDKSE